MHREVILQTADRVTCLSATAVLLAALVCTFPARMLAGELCRHAGLAAIEESDSERRIHVDVSAETLAQYLRAIQFIRVAHWAQPLRSDYLVILSELRAKLWIWTETMRGVGEVVPSDLLGRSMGKYEAAVLMRKAIACDPSNAGNHLALGRLLQQAADRHGAKKHFEIAANLFPANAAIRYQVSKAYAMMGDNDQALRHAQILAARDDSYYVLDTKRERLLRELQPTAYRTVLARSYLYQAYELAWMTSNRDLKTLRNMTPDRDDARDVLSLFFELKGIEEEGI